MQPFARNTVDPPAMADAARALGQPGPHWLLVDHAIVGADRAFALGRSLGASSVPVLASSPLAAFGEHGPHLWSIATGDEGQILNQLRRWISLEPTAAGLSWLTSLHAAQYLAELLAYLCLAEVDEDTRLHCRVADVRVLPSLLHALSPPQLSRLRRGIAHWRYFNAVGDWTNWTVDAAVVEPNAAPHLRLNAHQYAQVLDLSEPDVIFGLLCDKAPEVVPAQRRGDFRQQIAQWIEVARRYGVIQTLDRLQFCVLSCTLGEKFHERPELETTWQATRIRSASLKSEMETWSDSLWDRLETNRTATS